ncbi:hypothetical protein [Metabacillus fastidiosus]|uniref:hypothetical protein n=1 Tax=Metabacillus fastidiosus TaxID=1458 RepID=UPI000825CD47|nr:hypothetical protein [Metabacillus fastidiosus]MED4464749.1 hypothetical protein [Metabacillus fastidiosus]
MKIRELLELTRIMPLATIAKERLSIGEKPTREALKKAGCYAISGKRGWFYDGAESVLEQSIYDYSSSSKRKAKAKNSENTSINDSELKASGKQLKTEKIAFTSNQIVATSELDTIDKLLLKNEGDSERRIYRGFYWDKDIIDFLDSVKHGNKSDLMNEIVRTILKAKGLIKGN